MTEEEINNLKIGDKFTLEYTIEEMRSTTVYVIDANGSKHIFNKLPGGIVESATLVKPAPKFEVGDTVRIVPDPLTGTAYSDCIVLDSHIGKTGIVKVECDDHGQMQVYMGDAEENGYTIIIDLHCLELVKKAVKDRYKVEENDIYYCVIDGKWAIAHFSINSHPNAEAAAKAECDRLNAEWREQQEGKEGADHE